MAVWCSKFGTEVFEGKTQQTMHNHLVSWQMSTNLLESWRDAMLQTFHFPKTSSQGEFLHLICNSKVNMVWNSPNSWLLMFFYKHIYTHTCKNGLEGDLNSNPKGILPTAIQALPTTTPMLKNIPKTNHNQHVSHLMHEYKITLQCITNKR
jgi:hypothetical protein